MDMALLKIQKWVVLAAILLSGFLVLNFNYFWGNLNFIFSSSKSADPASQTIVTAERKMEPNTLIIESLDIKAPIIYVNEKKEKVYQAALINGVVHFPGTVNPGEFGNVYIFGHSSDYIWSKGKYKRIFAVLPKIKIGAEVRITNVQGNEFTYVVFDSRKVKANDLSVLSQGDYKKKLLTLQTSYPIGTALARWVVAAEIKE